MFSPGIGGPTRHSLLYRMAAILYQSAGAAARLRGKGGRE
jgi:hypothetical protein